jgi:hypothetical protein
MNSVVLSKSKKIKKTFSILHIEYCFCIFSFLMVDPLRGIYGGLGVQRYTIFFSLISCILVIIRIFKERYFNQFTKLILALGIVTTAGYITRASENFGKVQELLIYTYSYHLVYFFLTLVFLYYPPLILREKNRYVNDDVKIFFTIVSLLIPVFYIFFGSSLNAEGIILTRNQEEANLLYNDYLSVSDTLLFASLLGLSTGKNLISLIIYSFNIFFLFLIGSRLPPLIAIVAGTLCLSVIISNYYSVLKRTLSVSSSKFKLNILIIAFSASSFILSIVFFDRFYQLLNFDNILSSRVYRLIFDPDRFSVELNEGRGFIFKCFLNNHLSSFEKTMLGGPSDLGCSNVNYLHSTLSILVDYGIISFSLYLLIVYVAVRYLLLNIKIKSLRFELTFYLIFSLSLLFLGLSSRYGVSLWLPALAFCYSSAKIAVWKLAANVRQEKIH